MSGYVWRLKKHKYLKKSLFHLGSLPPAMTRKDDTCANITRSQTSLVFRIIITHHHDVYSAQNPSQTYAQSASHSTRLFTFSDALTYLRVLRPHAHTHSHLPNRAFVILLWLPHTSEPVLRALEQFSGNWLPSAAEINRRIRWFMRTPVIYVHVTCWCR